MCIVKCDYVSWMTFVLHFQFVLGYLILMEMVSYQEVKLKLCVKLLLKSEKKMLEKRWKRTNCLLTECDDENWEFDNKDLEKNKNKNKDLNRENRFVKLQCSLWLIFLLCQVNRSTHVLRWIGAASWTGILCNIKCKAEIRYFSFFLCCCYHLIFLCDCRMQVQFGTRIFH